MQWPKWHLTDNYPWGRYQGVWGNYLKAASLWKCIATPTVYLVLEKCSIYTKFCSYCNLCTIIANCGENLPSRDSFWLCVYCFKMEGRGKSDICRFLHTFQSSTRQFFTNFQDHFSPNSLGNTCLLMFTSTNVMRRCLSLLQFIGQSIPLSWL